MHIKLEDFTEILKSEGIRNPKTMAVSIFEKAIKVAIKDRYMVTGGAELQAKAKKVIAANKNVVVSISNFHFWLNSERANAGHRNIRPIALGHPHYTMLKEVCNLATDFCKELGYENYETGCRAFLRIGIDMSKEYRLSMFKSSYFIERIRRRVESLTRIAEDDDREATDAFYEYWKEACVKHFGIEWELKTPERRVNMVYAREEATAANADYKDWIDAIFDYLVFSGKPVEPYYFFGDQALQNYYRYMQVTKKLNKKQLGVVKEYKSNFQERYAEAEKRRKAV